MKIDPAAELNQEEVKPGAPAQPAARKSNRKTFIILLLLLSGLAFLFSTFLTDRLDGPTGDEPHYLVISQTLLLYHSLDVTLDYAHGDYKTFYGGPLGPLQHTSLNKWGQLLPLHSIGVPVLWLIPFAIAGKTGTLFFMSLVSLLIVFNVYLLLVALGIEDKYAFLTSLGVAVASPVWVFSHRNFVEPVAALLCIYVVRVLFQERLRAWDLLVSSAALGILPWIHIRFALFEAVLFCFLLIRIYQVYQFKKIRMYVYALLPVIALFLIFEAYNFLVWGSLNPAINQANSNEVPFDVSPWRGLVGLFLDQESGLLPNFPIFLFLFAGIILAVRKKYLRFNLLMLLLALPYIVTIAAFHNWSGAISPPARFMTVLVPLFAFYLALVLQQARNWFSTGLFLLFMGIALLYEGVSFTISGGWISWELGQSQPLSKIGQALHLSLTQAVPAFFSSTGKPIFPLPQQVAAFTGWLLFLIALTLATVLLARRAETSKLNPGEQGAGRG